MIYFDFRLIDFKLIVMIGSSTGRIVDVSTIGYPPILDNIEPRILPAGKRPDLTPACSFNGSDSGWRAALTRPTQQSAS
ncbi:MAG: hypothetical protein IPH23_02565 [Gammaproteobacteria bacterium]|nr:hypothetical protein [Gammaproteobacteria bacterium]